MCQFKLWKRIMIHDQRHFIKIKKLHFVVLQVLELPYELYRF